MQILVWCLVFMISLTGYARADLPGDLKQQVGALAHADGLRKFGRTNPYDMQTPICSESILDRQSTKRVRQLRSVEHFEQTGAMMAFFPTLAVPISNVFYYTVTIQETQ
jgi:hypothetical protein